MTKTVKIFLCAGILCVAAIGANRYVAYDKAEKMKRLTAYAVAHAPVEAKYMGNPGEYARQYVFAKVPPAGDFYEDENYRFQLLKGVYIGKQINGYGFSNETRSLFYLNEFTDWRTYLDYLKSVSLHTVMRRQLSPVLHYDAPFSLEALSPELYGELLPEGQKSYKLATGEPVLEILIRTDNFHGYKAVERHFLLKKISGHIVDITALCAEDNGGIAHAADASVRLMLSTLKVKNPDAFSGLDVATIIHEQHKWPEETKR